MARTEVKNIRIIEESYSKLEDLAAEAGRSLKNMNETLISEAHKKLQKKVKSTDNTSEG